MPAKKKKVKELKVELTKKLKKGAKVVYSNYGRFKIARNGKVNLVYEVKDKAGKVTERKLKANHA